MQNYVSVRLEVCFIANVTEITVVVPLLNDKLHEPPEAFLGQLSVPRDQSGIRPGQDTVRITINDDDSKY